MLLVYLKLESKWTQGREVAQIQSTNCASKWTLGREVAQIQSTNCADWHSKRLRARISGCPPLGLNLHPSAVGHYEIGHVEICSTLNYIFEWGKITKTFKIHSILKTKLMRYSG